MEEEIKIPEGLAQCPICGWYRGTVCSADLPEGSDLYNAWNPHLIEVDCNCNGVLCQTCKSNIVHQPGTNFYDLCEGDVVHVPADLPPMCYLCVVREEEGKG